AFFVLLLLLVTSFDRFRHATYEIFLVTYVVLSILILVACFYHRVTFEGHEYCIYLWPSVGVWALDRLLQLVCLCYCNVHVSSRGVLPSVSRMVYDEEADVVRLEVAPASMRLRAEAGLYYFLYQPFRFTWWESHHFTVGA
ncbi:hypothetical protein N7474_004553, partial [Penicillium riverlandense]|uniref:uncharacterized protein n=1 Tax=Penicillium riverlandense TaxID=1903569 RepID=UPI0025465C90